MPSSNRRRTPLWMAFGAFLVTSACAEAPTEPGIEEAPGPLPVGLAKGGNKGGGNGGSSGDGPFPATVSISATGNLQDDGKGAYVDGSCGVQAQVGSTIAYFKPDGRALKGKERNCGGRSATVVVTAIHTSSDPADHEGDVDLVALGIEETYDLISLKARLDSGIDAPATVNVGRCDTGMEFDPVEIEGSSEVVVTANGDASAWSVESRPYPDNLAGCLMGGATEFVHLNIDVDFAKN